MGVLVNWLSQAIQFFYILCSHLGIPSYGLAIIVFTVVVKAVLLPLTLKQLQAMRRMQLLQPKVQEIQKRYRNNPQKAQQEIMRLYQQHGANPLGGCLPLLIQLPILWALFMALRSFFDPVQHPAYVNLADARFLWIPNLGVPDPVILPLLAAGSTFLQQWVTMNLSGTTDQTQRTMLYIMPIFMGWICRSFPAGLALYWVVYSLVGIVEQFLLRREPVGVKEEIRAK
ncbi:MAG: YidC/Oxa1 family membrane protein insertase [Clostridia bacterium]|nr:YidC/Oxa1 family membrane protein insertase [Clostridia bacterium]MDH7573396.1 YidC/Oxa1 family membrane protein insertase [Clostridia bacterium]